MLFDLQPPSASSSQPLCVPSPQPLRASSSQPLCIPPPQPLHSSSHSLYTSPPQPLHTSTCQCVSNLVITDNRPPPSLSHAGSDANPNRRGEDAPYVRNIIVSVPHLSETSLMALSSQPHLVEQLPMQPTHKKKRGRVQGEAYVVYQGLKLGIYDSW